MRNLYPLSSFVYSLICISQFPISAAISSPTSRPSSTAWAQTPPTVPLPPSPQGGSCYSPRSLISTPGCPPCGSLLSLLGLSCSAWVRTLSTLLRLSLTNHLILKWGSPPTAWALTLCTGCPILGLSSWLWSGSDTPLWALGAAPTLIQVPTCSAQKEKLPPFCSLQFDNEEG